MATRLTRATINKLHKRIIDAGSLLKVIGELEATKRVLEEQAGYLVAHHEQAYNELGQLLREREQTELTVKNRNSEIATLDNEIEPKKMELGRLDKVIYESRERIYICDSIIAFLFARNGISEAQLDKLVRVFISLQKIRLGIEPKIVTDANDNVVCKCEVPKELGGPDLQGIDINKVREAFAYVIAPIVEDTFVPKIMYDIAITGREMTEKIAEVRKMAEKITRGSNV
jgi:hypothetical protein